MLKLMTPLAQIERFDLTGQAGIILASGYQGQWIVPAATYFTYPTSGQAGAFQIWTEGMRDGTIGFTPDVTNTGKLTVLYGKYRARTDRFNGAPTYGDKLTVNADGDLGKCYSVAVSGGAVGATDDITLSSDYVYAVCVGTSQMTYFTHNGGSQFAYIEYVTV
jgi:hypothetical protein